MTKSYLVALVLAVAFLFVANVRADIEVGTMFFWNDGMMAGEDRPVSMATKDLGIGRGFTYEGVDAPEWEAILLPMPSGYEFTITKSGWDYFELSGILADTISINETANGFSFFLAALKGFDNTDTSDLTITFYQTSTPEPATLAVLGLGLAGLGLARARRRK